MKKLISFCLLLWAMSAPGQVPTYNLNPVTIGTNSVAGSSVLTMPVLMTSVTTSVPTVTAYETNNARVIISTNLFTLPASTNYTVTNTFYGTNYNLGTNLLTWYESETVSNRCPVAYYVTNAAWISNYTGFGTNLYTTNAAVITTNNQTFVYETLVTYTNRGNRYDTNTVTSYGSSDMDVSRSATAALLWSFRLRTADASNTVSLYYHIVTDRTTTNNTVPQLLTMTCNGTNTVSTNLSLNVGPFGFVRLVGITNGSAQIVTNMVLKYAQKVSSP